MNDIRGGDELGEWQPFWTLDLAKGFAMLDSAVRTHVIPSRFGAPRSTASPTSTAGARNRH